MKKLQITCENKTFQYNALVLEVESIVNNWNNNAENHFQMASEIGNGTFSEDQKTDMLLSFAYNDILDAIDAKCDYEWKHNIKCELWDCGRGGNHIWLSIDQRTSRDRVLLITPQDPGDSESQDPVIEWKHAKWLVYLGVLFLLSRLLQNFVF